MPHADPETRRSYHKKYREDNIEKILAYQKNRYVEDWERRKEYRTGRMAATADYRRARGKIWQSKNLKQKEEIAGRPKPDKCEICARVDQIVFDHCHQKGHFRGWICRKCNISLGLMGDDVGFVRKLLEYLEKHNG